MIDSKLLKFGRKPERTAIRSFHMGRDAATVRYDEKDLSKNDRIKMIDQEESLIGYANVLYVKNVPAWNALDIIRKANALYSCDYSYELLEELNKHYGIHIGPTSQVKVVIYRTIQVSQ